MNAQEAIEAIARILWCDDEGLWDPDHPWDADTTEKIADIAMPFAFELHRREDPHCTCNDCIEWAAQHTTEGTTTELRCPKCGATGGFRYMEDIQNCRQVIGLEDGVLKIEAHYETGEGFDDGTNPRLLCDGDCCAEFPVPSDLEVDFV